MSPRKGLELQDILRTAVEIADTQGVEAVTLATLAKALNIRPPSLYNHVDGINGLRKKLALYGSEKLYALLAQAAIGRSGDDALRAIGAAYIEFSRLHPGLYDLTLTAPEEGDSELKAAAERILALVLQVLQAYDLEQEAALHAVRGFRSMIHGFASLEQKGGFKMALGLDESFRFLMDTFLMGIHALKSSTKN